MVTLTLYVTCSPSRIWRDARASLNELSLHAKAVETRPFRSAFRYRALGAREKKGPGPSECTSEFLTAIYVVLRVGVAIRETLYLILESSSIVVCGLVQARVTQNVTF